MRRLHCRNRESPTCSGLMDPPIIKRHRYVRKLEAGRRAKGRPLCSPPGVGCPRSSCMHRYAQACTGTEMNGANPRAPVNLLRPGPQRALSGHRQPSLRTELLPAAKLKGAHSQSSACFIGIGRAMPQSIGTSGIRHSGHAAATMPARADAGDTDGGGREPRKYPRSRYRLDRTRRRTNEKLAAGQRPDPTAVTTGGEMISGSRPTAHAIANETEDGRTRHRWPPERKMAGIADTAATPRRKVPETTTASVGVVGQ